MREESEKLTEKDEIQRKLIKSKDNETEKFMNEIESVKSESMNSKGGIMKKGEEKTNIARKFEEVKYEMMKMTEEMKDRNTYY